MSENIHTIRVVHSKVDEAVEIAKQQLEVFLGTPDFEIVNTSSVYQGHMREGWRGPYRESWAVYVEATISEGIGEPILVRNCARCGGEHMVTFREFTNPLVVPGAPVELTHWAPCPANGEPILMRFTDTPTEPPSTPLEPDPGLRKDAYP